MTRTRGGVRSPLITTRTEPDYDLVDLVLPWGSQRVVCAPGSLHQRGVLFITRILPIVISYVRILE